MTQNIANVRRLAAIKDIHRKFAKCITPSSTGIRTQKRVTAITKRDLDAKVADLKSSWNNGTFIEPDQTPLREWMDRKAASYSPNYVRELVNPLRMALATAVKRNIIAANPCDGIELPRVSRSTWSVLTEEEARRLITGTAADRYHALWVLAVTLGIRRGELLALRWSDIDLDRRTITIQRTITRDASGHWIVGHMPKTESSRRTIRIPERCLTALRHHRTRQLERRLAAGGAWLDTGAVFDRGLGEHWENGTSLWREFIATLDRLGLPRIRQHDLRHTAASHMLCAGIPVSTVSKILGHANPSITYRLYAHVIDEMHEEAVDRIDMMYEATGS